jgi:hypothetical protein
MGEPRPHLDGGDALSARFDLDPIGARRSTRQCGMRLDLVIHVGVLFGAGLEIIGPGRAIRGEDGEDGGGAKAYRAPRGGDVEYSASRASAGGRVFDMV